MYACARFIHSHVCFRLCMTRHDNYTEPVGTCVDLHGHIHGYITRMHIPMKEYMLLHKCKCKHSHAYTHTYICMHAYTHGSTVREACRRHYSTYMHYVTGLRVFVCVYVYNTNIRTFRPDHTSTYLLQRCYMYGSSAMHERNNIYYV